MTIDALFAPTSELIALRDSLRRFVERDYSWERRTDLIRRGVEASVWSAMAELGCLGAGLAEEAGGFGGGPRENAAIAEELGRGLVIEPFASHVAAATLLSQAQGSVRDTLLAEIVTGARRAVVANGTGWATDAFRLSIEGGDAHLAGSATFVDGGSSANILLIVAREVGGDALSLWAVDATKDGVKNEPYRALDSHRVSDIALRGVRVTATERIATSLDLADSLELAFDHATLCLCAEAVGIMDAALWLTRDYLQTRQQFGVPIGSFQALQHRMADMLIEVELARSLLFHALAAVDRPDRDERRRGISAAKVQIGLAGQAVGTHAVQLHGGIGMTEEYVIGHYYKRLFVIARQLGTSDEHLQRFAAATDQLAARATQAG
jgi:hypothetical protein